MFKSTFKKQKTFFSNRGFSLLELLLTIAIFTGASIATSYLIIDAGKATEVNGKKIQATLLAREGIEAVRSIRDADGFGSLSTTDATQGLAFSTTTNTWSLTGTPDVSSDGIYTRTIDISAGSDAHTKDVTSTVTATSGIRTISVSLSTQFTDWR